MQTAFPRHAYAFFPSYLRFFSVTVGLGPPNPTGADRCQPARRDPKRAMKQTFRREQGACWQVRLQLSIYEMGGEPPFGRVTVANLPCAAPRALVGLFDSLCRFGQMGFGDLDWGQYDILERRGSLCGYHTWSNTRARFVLL
jgi:hypothetical protein